MISSRVGRARQITCLGQARVLTDLEVGTLGALELGVLAQAERVGVGAGAAAGVAVVADGAHFEGGWFVCSGREILPSCLLEGTVGDGDLPVCLPTWPSCFLVSGGRAGVDLPEAEGTLGQAGGLGSRVVSLSGGGVDGERGELVDRGGDRVVLYS